jgi:pyrrolidone-carboxylate peptidase
MPISRRVIGLAIFSLSIAACKTYHPKQSNLDTDFGAEGNAAVVAQFDSYKSKANHCKSSSASKRVIVSGFGLFSGASFNISGVVVDTLANVPLTSISEGAKVDAPFEVMPGLLKAEDFGGRITQREIKIKDEVIDVCLILLEVKWDLAAAIILHEIEKFKPQLVVMTGRGGRDSLQFEGGAVNVAAPRPGFDSAGASVQSNTPLSNYILKNDAGVPAKNEIPMTWDGAKLAGATKNAVAAINSNYSVVAEPAARPSNDYICNNMSYVVLHALKGFPAKLAGESLEISTSVRGAKAGFLHYPVSAYNSKIEVKGWIKVLKEILTVGTARAD